MTDCIGCAYKDRGATRVCDACRQDAEKTYNRPSLPAPDVERSARHAPLEKKKGAGLVTPFGNRVRIHIHSKRARLCDADGISGKAALDGLVLCGVLEDDSPKYVESVSYSQEKSKDEETIITIEEV